MNAEDRKRLIERAKTERDLAVRKAAEAAHEQYKSRLEAINWAFTESNTPDIFDVKIKPAAAAILSCPAADIATRVRFITAEIHSHYTMADVVDRLKRDGGQISLEAVRTALKRAVARGFIEVTTPGTNRRGAVYRTTPKGREMVNRVSENGGEAA